MYATTLYLDEGATLDDLREAVTTLEETERTARRVMAASTQLTRRSSDALKCTRARSAPAKAA